MKLHLIISLLAVCFTSSCDRSSTDPNGTALHLHWFTIGSEQEFIPLQSSEILLGEDFDSGALKGKILKDSKGYHATLQGHHGLSTGDFRNYIEPDEIFGPSVYSYSGAIHATYFVVSSNPNLKNFYDELMKRRLVKPDDNGSYEIDLNLSLFVDPEPEA